MLTSRTISYAILSLLVVSQLTRADESPAQNKVIVNDPDDRLTTVPTNWWTYSHQSLQDVTNTVSAQNARIVDFTVEQVGPSLTLTVTYVENTGPYFKPWLWYAGIDAPTLANAISTFVHGATDNSYNSAKTTVATQNFLSAKSELLREQIVAGLASCGLVP